MTDTSLDAALADAPVTAHYRVSEISAALHDSTTAVSTFYVQKQPLDVTDETQYPPIARCATLADAQRVAKAMNLLLAAGG